LLWKRGVAARFRCSCNNRNTCARCLSAVPSFHSESRLRGETFQRSEKYSYFYKNHKFLAEVFKTGICGYEKNICLAPVVYIGAKVSAQPLQKLAFGWWNRPPIWNSVAGNIIVIT
jgi:hypothetical protein